MKCLKLKTTQYYRNKIERCGEYNKSSHVARRKTSLGNGEYGLGNSSPGYCENTTEYSGIQRDS